MSFKVAQNVVLANAAIRSLLSGSYKVMGAAPRVVSVVQPVNGNDATTLGAAVDMSKWDLVVMVGQTGVIDEEVRFSVRESDAEGGTYTIVPGFEFTYLDGSTGDDKTVVGLVEPGDLSEGNTWIKPAIQVDSGTSSLVSCVMLGLVWDRTQGMVAGDGIEDEYRPAGTALEAMKVRFFTNDLYPTRDTVAGDFTFAALTGSGVAVQMEGPMTLQGGQWAARGMVTVAAGESPTAEEIRGWALLHNGELVASERFETPKSIAALGDFVSVDLIVPIESAILAEV